MEDGKRNKKSLSSKEAKEKARRAFSPVSLIVISGILLVILTINGVLEIRRTMKAFYALLEREGLVLLAHYEKNLQETFLSFQEVAAAPGNQLVSALNGPFLGLEESVAEYVVNAAQRLDQAERQSSLGADELRTFAEQHGVGGIELYDGSGRLFKAWPPGEATPEAASRVKALIENRQPLWIDLEGSVSAKKDQRYWFSVGVGRKAVPGAIVLLLNEGQMKKLLLQFAVQRALMDMSLREGISFVVVQDDSLSVLASLNPGLVTFADRDSFLATLSQARSHRSRLYRTGKGDEVFEIGRPFFVNDRLAGILRIGFSPKEMDPILDQTKKNVVLSILIFLCLGVSGVTLIWINQNRHLQKMKELEDHLQRTERLSSLGHLAAAVAHEIRNPLNAIGLGIQRLRREFVPAETANKEQYLSFTEVMHREVKRVNEIIEDFLGLARPFHLDLRLASLEEVLRHLVLLFQEEARSRGLELEAHLGPNLPALEIDAQRLTQALVNIMKNGIEAMKPGGVLRLEARDHKDRVEVVIADSGEGIPKDQMGKIFDYYYTTKKKGAGLGLPIAHRIIEAHGGRMEVESQYGSGTRVTITFPIPLGRERRPTASGSPSGHSPHRLDESP